MGDHHLIEASLNRTVGRFSVDCRHAHVDRGCFSCCCVDTQTTGEMLEIHDIVLYTLSPILCRLGWVTAIQDGYDITFEEDSLDPESMRMAAHVAVWAHAKWLAVRQDLLCVPLHRLLVTYKRPDDDVTCWCSARVNAIRLNHDITAVNPGDTFKVRAFMDGYELWLTYNEVCCTSS